MRRERVLCEVFLNTGLLFVRFGPKKTAEYKPIMKFIYLSQIYRRKLFLYRLSNGKTSINNHKSQFYICRLDGALVVQFGLVLSS